MSEDPIGQPPGETFGVNGGAVEIETKRKRNAPKSKMKEKAMKPPEAKLYLTEHLSASHSLNVAFKVIVVSLLVAFLSYSHGAAIPDQILNQVQDFLVNSEPLATAVGMRVKRSTADWDKEFDMEALGLSFKLKYVDPTNPIKGGPVHMKFPAHRFVKSANFDDVELEFDFMGGEAVDGLFEMKFDYKFIQKFTFFADRPQAGTITLFRKFESGMWKTNMRLEIA